MAATENLSQLSLSHNSIPSRQGVLTLFGYGIQVRVHRGHLIIDDGIGAERTHFRLPRVGHGLKRLIIVGSDGMISLAALRWLSDQDAAFVMLERNGKVLATTGPVHPSDAKLRRAQALALNSEIGFAIARELISRKLSGQEQVARDILRDLATADEIARIRVLLPNAERLDSIRALEAQAAAAYWATWSNVPITFPIKDISRVPEHWRIFGTRKSLLSGSPRLAVNPANAMLNYLYALLESESRLAAAALGLDPGLGVLHVDTPARDSFACDLMEAVRPQIDRYVLTWVLSRPLRREWFFERRDGNCRLMASLAIHLSETVSTWGRAVAPVAEWVAHALWSSIRKLAIRGEVPPPTRLTQKRRTEARGKEFVLPIADAPQPENVCHGCGASTKRGQHCPKCGREISKQKLIELAKIGRLARMRPESRTKQAATQRGHRAAQEAWRLADQRASLTESIYKEQIQPRLSSVTISTLASTLGISNSYAADIRRGKHRPHPRHWHALAELVSVAKSL